MIKRPNAPRGISRTVCTDRAIVFSTDIRESDIKFVNALGFTVNTDSESGWMHIKNSVVEHTDYFGSCLLYCSSGAGTLFIESDVQCTLTANTFTLFDDTQPHSFKCHTPHVNLMVVGVNQRRYNPKKAYALIYDMPRYIRHSW